MDVTLVRNLMKIGVATCTVDTPMPAAVRLLQRHQCEAVVVLDERGHAAGLFGRREILEQYTRTGLSPLACPEQTVGQVMSPHIPEIPPDIPALAAAQIMLDMGVRALYLMHQAAGICWPAAELRFEDVFQHLLNGSNQSSPH
jgi:CBS domain-containing protein